MELKTPEEVAFVLSLAYAYVAWVRSDYAGGDDALHAAMAANVAMGDEGMKAFLSRLVDTYTETSALHEQATESKPE